MCLADLYPMREPLPGLIAFPQIAEIQDVMGFRLEPRAPDLGKRARRDGPALLCSAGVWTGVLGRWRLNCIEREYCRVVQGSVRVDDKHGRRWEFHAGSAFLLLRGFDGELEVLDPAQVVYMVFSLPDGGALDWCMTSEGCTALGRERLQS
jgi:uncharacterized cupin superfamily protein